MRENRKQLVIDYKVVFGSEEGKRVLNDLRKRAVLITGQLSTKGGVDVNALLIEEGRADVVKYIYRMIHTDPHAQREPLAQGE